MASSVFSIPDIDVPTTSGQANNILGGNLALTGVALDPTWANRVAAYTRGMQPPLYNGTTQPMSNGSITFAYTIYPYNDKTHELISEGMLVWISQYVDKRYSLANMLPLFKLNYEQRMARVMFEVPPNDYQGSISDREEFRKLVEKWPESALFAPKLKDEPAEMARFRELAAKPEFRHLTQWGIVTAANFVGSVQSKGYSDEWQDLPAYTSQTYSVGCVTGLRARVCNIWGGRPDVHTGVRLYLILRMDDKKTYVWVPWAASKSQPYPPHHLATYTDRSNSVAKSFVRYVGLCTENFEPDPSKTQVESAINIAGTCDRSAGSYTALPRIQIQIGV